MYNLAEETFTCSADSKARGSGGMIKAWRKHSEKGDEFQLGGGVESWTLHRYLS